MKTLIVKQGWTSDEYYDGYPDTVKLEFTEENIEKIRQHLEYAHKNKVTISANDVCSSSHDKEDEYREDVIELRIMQWGDIYYYSQSKYDATTQFESEGFELDDILRERILNDDES